MPPQAKKQRMSDEDSSARQTRSQTAKQAAAAATHPDDELDLAADDDDEEAFEYDSDVDSYSAVGQGDDDEQQEQQDEGDNEMDLEDQVGVGAAGRRETETLVLEDTDDEMAAPPSPVEPARPKGKLTARKQFALDVEELSKKYGGKVHDVVKDFKRDEGDETVRFSLAHADYPNRGLRLSLMFPELGGYPQSHEVMCFSENETLTLEVEEAMGEVASLPKHADRSLNGIIDFLLLRIVRGEPSPYTAAQAETDEDRYTDDEDLYDLGGSIGQDSETLKALRRDFKDLIAAGYRPGFTRISELELVVSVSKKVNTLGVPARALQAWDQRLITGEVVYLTLLMSFGRYPVDLDNMTSGQVRFKVGISPKHKPSRAAISAAFRSHSSSTYTKGEFEAISLSAPLDALLNNKLGEILYTRRCNDRCGWAAAEQHCFEVSKSDGAGVDSKAGKEADKAELATSEAQSGTLPNDAMADSKTSNNFPLLAFSYLLRRFVMCPRFCLNCYKRVDANLTALKPYVCETPLCLFQLIALGLGPSLEHEIITNAPAVDLLVQLCYTAAKENGLKDELFPVGLELQVPKDKLDGTWKLGDETVDFDTLTHDSAKCAGVAALILELPPISEMKVWLTGEDMTDDERILNRTRKLPDMRNNAISTSAWRLLRWIVASNTAELRLIEDEDELLQGVPKTHRQFRLIVGSPQKEHLLKKSVEEAQKKTSNAVKYPTLFAWHGSSTKNWHSILRQGLHFKETVNGRAYGHGVYFAKTGELSLGHYSQATNSVWKNAEFGIAKLAAICEIANRPKEFISTTPYFVVDKIDWIQARYLIVERGTSYSYDAATTGTDASFSYSTPAPKAKLVKLDPAHPLTLSSSSIGIPDVADKLAKLEASLSDKVEELNDSDNELMKEPSVVIEPPAGSQGGGNGGGGGRFSKLKRAFSGASVGGTSSKGKSGAGAPTAVEEKKEDDFVPCDEARLKLMKLLPPPAKPNMGALATLQREVKAMMKEQEKRGPTECGFYFDPERSEGNMFTMVVEIPRGSFDQDIPLVKDMKAKDVESILMEIRFGDSYPFSPPFFRVVHPRFLPFIHGGGGHVTGGGSICMDLLTNDGWSSIYSTEAILLQIRVAMSNLEPRPGRLDPTYWNSPYSMEEAVAGFKRAAATHGWTVPPELDALTRGG
ncbi:hypothetical protein JCM8547_005715 [Rhodosporidiobolus lusitaniae]